MSALFIEVALKSSLVMTAAAAVVAFLHRRTSAATRHLVWTLAVTGLLVLPVLSVALPRWQVAIRVSSPAAPNRGAIDRSIDGMSPAVAATEPGSRAARMPWSAMIAGLFVVGIALLSTRLVAERWTVHRLLRHGAEVHEPRWKIVLADCARQLGVRRPVRLVSSREHTMPMTVGTWRPAIVMPAVAETWDDDRTRAVLLHELAHVARFDCLTQTLAALACAFYWPHPGVWWTARRLRVERELACDDRVLAAGTRPREYAAHLLELAYTCGSRRTPAIAVSMARPGDVEWRLRAILDAARRRAAPKLRTLVWSLAVALAMLIPLAALDATMVESDAAARHAPVVQSAPAARAAHVDPESALIDELLSQNYTRPDRRQLDALAHHGVNVEYVREMGRLEYWLRTVDELIRLKDHGVSPQFVRDLRAQGLAAASADDLVRARDHGVSSDYVGELRALGYTLSFDDLVRGRDHGVSAAYIRDLAALGYKELSFDDLIRFRDHGVSAAYIQQFRRLGFSHLTPDQLIWWRDRGFVSGLHVMLVNFVRHWLG